MISHARHPYSTSMRGPHLPVLKEFHLTDFFDYDRFFHSPWGHVFPPVNLKENEKSYEIELMVPGREKKDFNIFVDEGFLIVSAENTTEREVGSPSFTRSFHLPINSNEQEIQAKYDAGVLKLIIPKKNVTEVKTKKPIEVK
jgi:HSP20 family protein